MPICLSKKYLFTSNLNSSALQFSQALTYLDTAQQEVKASIAEHTDMQKKVK